jgi:hypothetical protein
MGYADLSLDGISRTLPLVRSPERERSLADGKAELVIGMRLAWFPIFRKRLFAHGEKQIPVFG